METGGIVGVDVRCLCDLGEVETCFYSELCLEKKWEDALKSNEVLGPPMDQYSRDLKWTDNTVAKPGITKFS